MQCAFERIETLFLAKDDGQQNGLHRVVAGLIRGGLRVATGMTKQTVEAFLVFSPQCTAEFRPPCGGLFEKLTECGNRAAHDVLGYGKTRGFDDAVLFSLFRESLPSSFSVNFHT